LPSKEDWNKDFKTVILAYETPYRLDHGVVHIDSFYNILHGNTLISLKIIFLVPPYNKNPSLLLVPDNLSQYLSPLIKILP